MENFSDLRKKYPIFTYNKFDVCEHEGLVKVTYTFTQSADIIYNPYWVFPFNYSEYSGEKKQLLDRVFFNLGLTELVSYWKACASPTVNILCGSLDLYQKEWWKKLWYKGLGEFFYRNKIQVSYKDFITINVKEDTLSVISYNNNDGFLIPVGGGKDSCVTMDLLKMYNKSSDCMIINSLQSAVTTAHIAGFDDKHIKICKRTLSPRLLELNSLGYLNGHTPFSSVIAFAAYICAVFLNKKYIVLSNESSANDVYVKGTTVNHQYSKSLEFENDFREYIFHCLSSDISYFSLLRPLNEMKIVEYFVDMPKYLYGFKSCNLGSKKNIWCCNCSKCFFVYIMLSPFIEQKELENIFGKNLLRDKNMLKYLEGLVCVDKDKPFECIGTRREINAALSASLKKLGTDYFILKEYADKYYNKDDTYEDVYNFFDLDNNVPEFIRSQLGWNKNL